MRRFLLAATVALLGCQSTPPPTLDDILLDMRSKRATANEQVIDILKREAEAHDTTSPHEHGIECANNIRIFAQPNEATTERLAALEERFTLYRALFDRHNCKKIYLLPFFDDFEFFRDRSGMMEHTGNMTFYAKHFALSLCDHEMAHAVQHADMNATRKRHAQLHFLDFQNKDYDKDRKSIWLDGTTKARGYFIDPYANTNALEYEAQFVQETAKLLRGDSSCLRTVDYTLPRWPTIITTLSQGLLHSTWAQSLTTYFAHEDYRNTLHAAITKWGPLEDPQQLAEFNKRYHHEHKRAVLDLCYDALKNNDVRTLAFDHPRAALRAHQFIMHNSATADRLASLLNSSCTDTFTTLLLSCALEPSKVDSLLPTLQAQATSPLYSTQSR